LFIFGSKYTSSIVNRFLTTPFPIMKLFLTLLIIITFSMQIDAQQQDLHEHNRYCRHYTEHQEISSFAYRNDWQSPFVHDYDVKFYWLDISVSSTSVNLGGKVTIHADVKIDNFTTFAFELVPQLTISQIVFNGQVYTSWNRDGDNVLLSVPALNTDDSFVAEIAYGGTPPSGGFFAGITNATSNTWGKQVTWTLSEPFNAKQWWPVKQVLTDKADSVWVFLTTAATNMAGSQGLLTNTVDLGNGQKRYEWKSRYPIAYYLISFAVADYLEYNIYAKPAELEGDSILVQNFLYNHPNYLQQNKTNIDATVPMLELFSDLYTLYPFEAEKYGHCITELGGGMEHQTMSTMGGWSFNLVSHELGHMWFGDNVTCATWSDIWINEGFATYSNYLAHEFLNGWNSGQTFMVNTQNNVMSQPGGSVYIPPSEITQDNIWRIFNGRLSYDKGAAIIHVLRHEINNDDLFFETLQSFQQMYSDTSATGEDFKHVAEDITGLDLDYFFDQWYYGQGYPIYDIVWYMNGDQVTIMSSQSTSTQITPLFDMYIDFKLTYDDNTFETVRLHQDANIKTFNIPVTKTVDGIAVDPDNWTFEKVNSIIVGNIEGIAPNYFTIFPNPTESQAIVSFAQQNKHQKTLKIYSVSGKLMLQQIVQESQLRIDLNAFPSGVYFVELSDGTLSDIQRLIKL